MRKTLISGRVTTAVVLLILALLLPSARAQNAAEKLYKAKCAMCHGADGSGDTPAGKKMAARDFRLPEVQKQTDAQLIEITVKGKNKMPGFDKKLAEEQIKQLVAYIRELAKKKK